MGGAGKTGMDRGVWHELVDQLRGTEYRFGLITPDAAAFRIEFDPGLTDAEVAEAESRFGFRFPPDRNPYGDGKASLRVVDELERLLDSGAAPATA